MQSPIVYFGGKNVLSKKMMSHIPCNFDTFVEPFGGSFGFGFRISQEFPKVQRIYNDLNLDVYNLFTVLAEPTSFEEFSRKISLLPYHEKFRDEAKIKQNDDTLSDVERAIWFFYVNRSSVNGIGGFSVPNFVRNGMNKSVSSFLGSIEGLPEVHKVMTETAIYNRDAFEIIEKYRHSSNCFLYLDPPYHHSVRSSTRYKHDLTDTEQDKFLELIQDSKARIMISGYECDAYQKAMSKGCWERIEMKSHSVNGAGVVNSTPEILWTNYSSVRGS